MISRRTGEEHTQCLNSLYATLNEEMRLWIDTVDALALIAATTRKLWQSLHILDITQTYLHEDLTSEPSPNSCLSKMPSIDLTSAYEAYKTLETTLRKMEKDFQEGWIPSIKNSISLWFWIVKSVSRPIWFIIFTFLKKGEKYYFLNFIYGFIFDTGSLKFTGKLQKIKRKKK